MWPFTPRYIKHAKLLLKGVTRFLDYKKDLLPAAKYTEIAALRAELVAAMKQRDRAKIDLLHTQLNQVCEAALPEHRPGVLGENVEVIFVTLALVLGIRAYIAQPFQIPTGSMQPTLNGFIAEASDKDPRPALPMQFVDWFMGKKYFNVVSDHSGYLAPGDFVTEHRWLLLFTFSRIHFADGHYITVNAPKRQLVAENLLGLSKYLRLPRLNEGSTTGEPVQLTPDGVPEMRYEAARGRIFVKEGQLLARGILTTGDHVIVGKMAYHFRTPTRGEVFVFTTKNIAGISVAPEQGSQHYIKRLVATPGDHVEIAPTGQILTRLDPEGNRVSRESGKLLINGKAPEESGMKRVAAATEPGYNGYFVVGPYDGGVNSPISGKALGPEEYCAMGDNSLSSLDSRYWGSVPRRNLVGVGLLTYWPLGPHWGLID